MNEVAQTIVFFLELSNDAIDLAPIDRFQMTAGGIGEHFLGQTRDHKSFAFLEHLLEFHDVGYFLAIAHGRGSVDWFLRSLILIAPATYHIEVLEGKPHWVDLGMATEACLVLPV